MLARKRSNRRCASRRPTPTLKRTHGTHPVTRRRFTIPLILVAVAAVVFLHNLPKAGHDVTMGMIGAIAGIALGVMAGSLVRVGHDATGTLVTRAGLWFAALWVVVIGSRIAFAYGASGPFAWPVARFSVSQHITGPQAWVAAFVITALAMVATRLAMYWPRGETENDLRRLRLCTNHRP